MGFDLEGKGGSFRCTIGSWLDVLELGELYGWEPMGTGAPKGVSAKEWQGEEYCSNDGLLFKARDAKNLAKALSRALAKFPEIDWPADAEPSETRAWLSTEAGKKWLEEFIVLLRAGSFRLYGENAEAAPNKALQQTAHANDGFSRFHAASRVSRLLSWLFGNEAGAC